MKNKKNRKLKIYGQSNGYNYKDVPAIVLKGKWLEDAGFRISDSITVDVQEGNIVISKCLSE
ncbi:MAG: type I toxin-antitoxin system SymE family toxin [Dorea sp.]|nr:type I toxin-antitoxin system SymE family toxin [Dorea sp.]